MCRAWLRAALLKFKKIATRFRLSRALCATVMPWFDPGLGFYAPLT